MSGQVPTNPDDMNAWLAEQFRTLQAQIDELKGARAMMATIMQGGTFELREESGARKMLRFGSFGLADDGTPLYGIVMYDNNGAIVQTILDNGQGMVYPHEFHQWIVPTPQSITSTTFVGIAECEVVLVNEDTLVAAGAVITPAGSTAELRVTGAGQATDPVFVDQSKNGTVIFEWIHPYTVGWGDTTSTLTSALLHYEARLASGPGPITVYPPRHLTFRNKRFMPLASVTGGGRLA